MKDAFEFVFHLPYLALRKSDQEDTRTWTSNSRPLRQRYKFPSLEVSNRKSAGTGSDSSVLSSQYHVYEAQVSNVVFGLSDEYWNAVCLEDHFFNRSSDFDSEDQEEDIDGSVDPIVGEAREAPKNASRTDPRCYMLQSLANKIRNVVVKEAERLKDEMNRRIVQYVSPGQIGATDGARLIRRSGTNATLGNQLSLGASNQESAARNFKNKNARAIQATRYQGDARGFVESL